MSHELYAKNKALPMFYMRSAWAHLLEQCGAYFTCIQQGPRWYMLYDERMITHNVDDERKEDKNYPAILCNCGFEITEEEAKVLARIASNYAAIQRTLTQPSQDEIDRSLASLLWIRHDWVELYEEFAEWAEQSQGFKVY